MPNYMPKEQYLLERGSKQENLWGINLYLEKDGDDFIEFDSMINLKPSQSNYSRGVDNPEIQKKIIRIVNKLIKRWILFIIKIYPKNAGSVWDL